MAAQKKPKIKAAARPKNRGGRVRTDLEIAQDQELMFDMIREGLRPPQILERINEIRPYKIGLVTVYKDIQNACSKAWDRICDKINAMRAHQIQEHLHAADEAMDAWIQSKQPIKKQEIARTGGGRRTRETTKVSEEERPGDPRFLALWLQIQTRLSFLYGIREEIDVNVNDGSDLDIQRAETFYTHLTRLRSNQRTAKRN
jgi:hypothetical protein